MSDMKFGEDWTSSFGEEDVLTYCGRTDGRTHGRTDGQKFLPSGGDQWAMKRVLKFFLGQKSKKTHRITLPYSRPLSGAANKNLKKIDRNHGNDRQTAKFIEIMSHKLIILNT